MNNKTEDSEGLFGGSRRVPVVIRSFEDALGHMVGMAEIESDGVNMVARITLDHAQGTGRGLGIKHNPGLLQNPRFDALMVYVQQV